MVVGLGFVSISPAFMKGRASHPEGPHDRSPRNGKSTPLLGREFSIQFAQQFVTAVTAPPLVGCVVLMISYFMEYGATALDPYQLHNR